MNEQKTYTPIKKDFDNHGLILSSNHTKPKLLYEVRINHCGYLNDILNRTVYHSLKNEFCRIVNSYNSYIKLYVSFRNGRKQ